MAANHLPGSRFLKCVFVDFIYRKVEFLCSILFSDRISNLHPSAIREILKNSDPNVISLAAGNPAVESFPVAEMKEIADNIFDTASGIAFQYGITEGYPRLRQLVMKRQKENTGWQ